MTKEELVAFISDKARISQERAELAYNAFWEAILSELKTGHFSLPYGPGTIQLKEKASSGLKEALKEIDKQAAKAKKTQAKVPVKSPAVKNSKPAKKASAKTKAPVKAKAKVKAKVKKKK